MEEQIHVRRLDAALVVSKRLAVRLSEIGGVIGPAFGEVYGHLGARGVAGDGPPFVIYHGSPAESDPFDIEICAPVARRTDPPAGWQVHELPAGSFATLVHVGRTTRSRSPTTNLRHGSARTISPSRARPARST